MARRKSADFKKNNKFFENFLRKEKFGSFECGTPSRKNFNKLIEKCLIYLLNLRFCSPKNMLSESAESRK